MRPLWVLASLSTLAAAYFAGEVLIPLVVSLFLAILLEPSTAWLERRGMNRGWASSSAMLLFLIILGGAAWGCSRPFSNLAAQMPQYASKIKAVTAAVDRQARRLQRDAETGPPAPAPVRQAAEQAQAASERSESKQFLLRGIGSVFQAAGIAVFVPFLMMFFLIEKDLLLGRLKKAFGAARDFDGMSERTGRMVRAFFFGNFLTGVGLALGHWIVFAALGLKNAIGLGILTGFISVIPILGLPAALILPAAQGLLQFDRAAPFVALVLSLSALHLAAANFVIPRLVGAHVKINATAATLGMLFWGWLWGITGFLLAVPLTALLKIGFDGGPHAAALAEVLGVDEERPRHWFRRAHGRLRALGR